MASSYNIPTNLSGTIRVGSASQLLVGAAQNRTRFFIQNLETATDLWWSPFGPAAASTVGSVRIASQTSLQFDGTAPGSAYYLFSTLAGHKFTAWVDF